MIDLHTALKKFPLIAILRGIRPDEVIPIATALVEHGFTCLEVPLNSPQPYESIASLADQFGDRVLIGAGTVTDIEQVKQVASHGGRLIISPHSDTTIIRASKEQQLYSLPGFSTPTEAFSAIKAGADALKLFPAEAHPPKVLKALKAILPKTIPILPVGGISPENMSAYCAAGAAGFGLGSALYKANDTVITVAGNAKKFAQTVKEIQFHSLP